MRTTEVVTRNDNSATGRDRREGRQERVLVSSVIVQSKVSNVQGKAGMAEQVDAATLKLAAARRVGSSPTPGIDSWRHGPAEREAQAVRPSSANANRPPRLSRPPEPVVLLTGAIGNRTRLGSIDRVPPANLLAPRPPTAPVAQMPDPLIREASSYWAEGIDCKKSPREAFADRLDVVDLLAE